MRYWVERVGTDKRAIVHGVDGLRDLLGAWFLADGLGRIGEVEDLCRCVEQGNSARYGLAQRLGVEVDEIGDKP